MKVIKRYSNRKLYDTERSCYVTLDEIAVMVREGEELRIVDNRTGEDLTTVTLAQILFEEEKKEKRALPLQMMRQLIQSPTEFIQRIAKPVSEFRDETQRQVERLRKNAEARQEEFIAPVREFIDGVQRSVDEMQDRFDDRLRDTVDALTHVPDLESEHREMKARLTRLERDMKRVSASLEAIEEALGVTAASRRPADPRPTSKRPRG